MRRILPGILAVLVPALVLAGCGGGGGGSAPPGPSVRGTWLSEAAVDPQVKVIVRDYLGSREMSAEGITITCYFYSGEIQCSVYEGGSCSIAAIPTEPPSGSFIYAATVLGQNMLVVQGIGGNPSDLVMFSGSLSGANTAEGFLMIKDDNELKWSNIAAFTRS